MDSGHRRVEACRLAVSERRPGHISGAETKLAQNDPTLGKTGIQTQPFVKLSPGFDQIPLPLVRQSQVHSRPGRDRVLLHRVPPQADIAGPDRVALDGQQCQHDAQAHTHGAQSAPPPAFSLCPGPDADEEQAAAGQVHAALGDDDVQRHDQVRYHGDAEEEHSSCRQARPMPQAQYGDRQEEK